MYWNHSNHKTCSAFTANEKNWFEDRRTRGRYYGNIVSVSKKSGGFPKGLCLKDGLAKYDVGAG